MHKPKSVLVDETHKIHRNFEILTDKLMPDWEESTWPNDKRIGLRPQGKRVRTQVAHSRSLSDYYS